MSPNGGQGDGVHTCPECGGQLHGGGHGGADFCDTPGCKGNYYGGDRKLEAEAYRNREEFYIGSPKGCAHIWGEIHVKSTSSATALFQQCERCNLWQQVSA